MNWSASSSRVPAFCGRPKERVCVCVCVWEREWSGWVGEPGWMGRRPEERERKKRVCTRRNRNNMKGERAFGVCSYIGSPKSFSLHLFLFSSFVLSPLPTLGRSRRRQYYTLWEDWLTFFSLLLIRLSLFLLLSPYSTLRSIRPFLT